jgi:signal transduction histidine kinase
VENVKKTVAIFQEKGRDYALKAINSKMALTDKELYVFALTMDNLMLAHPHVDEWLGKDMSETKDSNGKAYFQEFKKIAQNPGEGWVDYMWNRPGENAPRFKRSYIMKVPGQEIYVGSGYYPALAADRLK